MKTWHDRANDRIKQLGLTRTAVAKSLGVSQQTLSTTLNLRSRSPSSFSLEALANVLSVRALWLKEGVDEAGMSEDMVAVKVIEVLASAGSGSFNDDYHPITTWPVPAQFMPHTIGDPNIIQVHGDSMEPNFMSGDMVMIDTGYTKPSPPGDYVIMQDGTLLLKKLEFSPQDKILKVSSYNSFYSAYEHHYEGGAESSEDLRILGRVLWNLGSPL